ncbi:exo-alpha-sialidase, partial [bacterium]|nr:exo-alpha-sialidase [bacterium]
RAGPNGLFYYSGIAFDRGKNGLGILFVARFIDNNFISVSYENGTQIVDADQIKYLDTTKIDEGTAGQFADKPWIAVDKPRYGDNTVPIDTPNAETQLVAQHIVYIVYSVFLGETPQSDHSKILFARSTDCGTTWEVPYKISEGQQRNQGTTMAVSPKDGTIYIAWRRFVSPSQPDAIMMCKSEDFGLTFNKAVEVAAIHPFDQFLEFDQVSGKYIEKFRTYAFPTLAVDHAGHVYVAWADRGDAAPYNGRIVIKTSPDGIDWSGSTTTIDNSGGCGHQFMPSSAYAAGKLMITWYDSRESLGNDPNDPVLGCGSEISDPGPSNKRHTIDVRIAQSPPSPLMSFSASKQVSKYLHCVKTDEITGEILEPIVIEQREYNPPNYPLFVGGTVAFIGDYIDITPAPAFLFDPVEESWHFNTGYTPNENPQEVPLDTFHVTWTDNRDVRPPSDDDWKTYTPPNVPTSTTPCIDGAKTGMRNQNIYTSAITRGIIVGAPVNTKRLIPLPSPNLEGNAESYEQKL